MQLIQKNELKPQFALMKFSFERMDNVHAWLDHTEVHAMMGGNSGAHSCPIPDMHALGL